MNEAGSGRDRPARILVVAAFYPPSSAAAATRARNIVRNLQALGHEVRVITARSGGGETPPEARSLPWLDIEELGQRLLRRGGNGSTAPAAPPRVWQQKLRVAVSRVVVPDLRAPWIPVAVPPARRAALDSEVVVSTGGASAHVVARIVRGQRPWVADINDLWWRNPHRHAGALRLRIDLRTEKGILEGATALTVPVETLGDEVRRRTGRPATTVLTGFDPAEFRFEAPSPTTPHHEVLWAGTLYSDFRLPLVLEALRRGRDEHGWTPSTLRIRFFGTGASQALASAAEHGVDEFIAAHAPIPRSELLEKLAAADALLFPLYESDPFHLPMRFFDFVGAGRPLLGVGADTGPAAAMIRRHGLGMICASVAKLVSAFDEIARGSRPPDLSPAARRPFELASGRPELRNLLDSLVPQ